MLRATLLAITLLCVAPVGAVAAVGQVAPIPGRGYDDCLQVTGLPGELVMPAPGGVQFVAATREGLRPGTVLRLADDFECGSVVSRTNGAGVIAGTGRQASAVTVRVREPGSGTWGALVTLALQAEWRPEVVRAAVSDRGDVVVVWRESRSGPDGSIRRVRVARRSPGGAFGPAELLGKAAKRHELVLPAVAATGEAFVLTTTAPDTGAPDHVPLRMWTAAPGAAFEAPQRSAGCTAITHRGLLRPRTDARSWPGATAPRCA